MVEEVGSMLQAQKGQSFAQLADLSEVSSSLARVGLEMQNENWWG